MRLSPARFAETVAAALEAGITVFDTARAYGESERLLAEALGGAAGARIVTKGGMRETWIPDGRAKTILADCEASLRALDGHPIDTYLIHAPDPRTPWRTTVRALARLLDEGMAPRIGVSNVNRRQLDEALELAPIAAVEVALSVLDDRAVRGGVLERCAEVGIALIAHSPLGGPRRTGAIGKRPELVEAARAHDVSPAEVALARVLALAPGVVAIPGATRPETARSAARAARLGVPAGLAPDAAQAPYVTALGRRGRARHGHPGRRQDPPRAGLHSPRVHPAQPRRARGRPARARQSARTPSWRTARGAWSSTTPT